jgi:hypothetical protein
MSATQITSLLARRDFSTLIKLLTAHIEANDARQEEGLLLNRALCWYHLGMYRKALKVMLSFPNM